MRRRHSPHPRLRGGLLPGILKLAAIDAEDLQIVSACLQDAVGRVGDTAYLPKRRRFAALFNRFRWENEAASGPERSFGLRRHERVRCAVHFDGVLSVRTLGMTRSNPEQLLDLLSIQLTEIMQDAVQIRLLFAGGAEILLEAECIDCYLEDLSQPWPASSRPAHLVED